MKKRLPSKRILKSVSIAIVHLVTDFVNLNLHFDWCSWQKILLAYGVRCPMLKVLRLQVNPMMTFCSTILQVVEKVVLKY
jgi:hypothetical protein